jgi:1-acyl-sn-glycerol-3-phosphate acyltransferase
MIRTAITTVALVCGTIVLGTSVIVAQLLGVRAKPRGIFELAPRAWAWLLLRAAGVRVVRHGGHQLVEGAPRVFIANHVSWFDIPAMIEVLPHYGFVAKRELERIPLFGAAARAVGVIFIDRENRKAAFGAYEDAAQRIRAGHPVLVYPEGTRGTSYALRSFKKGPFVLAIGSQAPVVPVVIHGTIEVNPRGQFRANSGTVHVHLLDPIPTEGLTYDDRDALAQRVRAAMAECLRDVYGVESHAA